MGTFWSPMRAMPVPEGLEGERLDAGLARLFGFSRTKAAELAGLDLYGFMLVCKDNRIPVIDVSRTDLLEELSGFMAA